MPTALVLYNEPTLPADHPDADSEHDILYTADTVARALQGAHLSVRRLGLGADPKPLLAALEDPPDVVFNLYEGQASWGATEAFVAGLLELKGVPFTGSPTQPILLCRSKPLTKQLLAGAGLPTAGFLVVDGDEPTPDNTLGWPVIVKPGREDASVGIDQGSVVTSQAELEARVTLMRERYGPTVLIERFVRGREFNVALLERGGQVTALPFSEILFVPPPDAPGLWPIVSFDAKWHPGTVDFTATPAKNPADVSPELRDKVTAIARKAFELVGCRDYARVDFRVDEAGEPFVLEVNPNPCISPLAGLAAGLESAQVPYPDFLLGLVRNALLRGPRPELAAQVGSTPAKPAPPDVTPRQVVRVRRARAGDLDAFAADPAAADLVRRAARRPRRAWVAVVGRAVVGVAAVLGVRDGVATVGVTVRPASRRRGAGTALVRALLTRARGARWVEAHTTTAPHDAPARQFLARHGWHPAGDLPDFTKDGYARLTFAHPVPTPASANQTIPQGGS